MSRRDLIDPEVREPLDQLLEAIPGGFDTIPTSSSAGPRSRNCWPPWRYRPIPTSRPRTGRFPGRTAPRTSGCGTTGP